MISCEVTVLSSVPFPTLRLCRDRGVYHKCCLRQQFIPLQLRLPHATRGGRCVAAPQLCDSRASTPRSLRSHGAHAYDARSTGFVWGYDRFINRGLGEVVYPTSSMPYSVALSYPMPSLRSTWGFLLHRAFGTCLIDDARSSIAIRTLSASKAKKMPERHFRKCSRVHRQVCPVNDRR